MLSRINKLLVLLALLAGVLYMVVLNQDAVTLRLGSETSVSGNSGVLFIAVFCTGILVAALVAALFGIRTYFRERRFKSEERRRQQFFDGLVKARSLTASGEWARAKSEWEGLLKKDPSGVVARVELAKTHALAGDLREALKILDAARAQAPNNVEVLFRAAELNLELGNKTAAVDNLALVLYQEANRKAAELARNISEELGRFEDALEYAQQAERLGANGLQGEEHRTRLEFKKLLADDTLKDGELLDKLKQFVKRHYEFVPAIHALAAEEERIGNFDLAAGHLVRAGKIENSPGYLTRAAELWVSHEMPDKALATLRSAAKDARGEARIAAELNLIRLYLRLQMFSEAERSINDLSKLVSEQGIETDTGTLRELMIFRGYCLSSMGRHHECGELWQKLRDQDYALVDARFEAEIRQASDAPAPRLSTP